MTMDHITAEKAAVACDHLHIAYEKALLASWDDRRIDFHRTTLMVALHRAVKALGYTLNKIPQPGGLVAPAPTQEAGHEVTQQKPDKPETTECPTLDAGALGLSELLQHHRR